MYICFTHMSVCMMENTEIFPLNINEFSYISEVDSLD